MGSKSTKSEVIKDDNARNTNMNAKQTLPVHYKGIIPRKKEIVEIVRNRNPADFPASATKASVFWSNCFELAFWRFGILAMGSFQFTQWRGKSISCSQQPRLSLNALLGVFFSIKDILVGNVPFSVTQHLTVVVPLQFWNICDIVPLLGWKKKSGLLSLSCDIHKHR